METTPGMELDIRKDDGLTRIVLTRPQIGNSLSSGLVNALTDAVSACYEDGTRILVIEGSGPNFCTGFDLSDLESETDDSLLARFVRVELLLQKVYYAPFLTVALAQGRAFGAGADLFAACEQRWIVESAMFSFPGASARSGPANGAGPARPYRRNVRWRPAWHRGSSGLRTWKPN